MRRLSVLASSALLLTGCGGGGGGAYSALETASCLQRAGARPSASGADYIAQGATGGGYEVIIDGKILNIAFGESVSEAKQLLESYQAAGGDAAVYRQGNAVLVWDDAPGTTRDTVDGCLTR